MNYFDVFRLFEDTKIGSIIFVGGLILYKYYGAFFL